MEIVWVVEYKMEAFFNRCIEPNSFGSSVPYFTIPFRSLSSVFFPIVSLQQTSNCCIVCLKLGNTSAQMCAKDRVCVFQS